jgi:holo-[acyl-carrier protein] synthase
MLRMETGVDLVEIPRIAKAMEKEAFLRRFFSEEEQAYFQERAMAPQTVAGHFAAKEAFSKALGTGIRGFELREVSIRRDSLGKPSFRLTGKAAELARGWSFSLSITHTRDTAAAVVAAWREEPAGKEEGE